MRNVLLIEDDLDITELIAYNLQKAGFKVHTADCIQQIMQMTGLLF